MKGLLRRRRALQFLTSDQEVLRRRQWDYVRLLGIASVDAIFAIPMTVYFIVMNARSEVYPWISWADTHFNYSRVIMVPRMIWTAKKESAAGTELNRWVIVSSALLFIINFGPAADSRRHLKQMGSFVAGSFRRGSSGTASGSSDPMGSMEAASHNRSRPVEISLDRRRYSETSVIDIQKMSLGSDPKRAI
jgi:pheromone a factor receptor